MTPKAAQVILSDEAEAAIAGLRKSRSKEAASILRRVVYYEERLRVDCLEGEVIPCPLKRKARALEARHGQLGNLYCCDLPGFWRLLHTIVRADGAPFVYVLEVVDHAAYSQWL